MKMKTLLAFTFIAATLALLWPEQSAWAQAPAGPMTSVPQPAPGSEAKTPPAPPPPPPRQSILGAWRLNRDESDDPRDRMREPENPNGGYGRRGGTTWPGGGAGGGGGYGGRRMGGESDEERQKMRELLTPPKTMTLSMTGAEVDLMDDRDRKRAFMTDGRKLQKSKDASYQEIAAKWDGNRLVSEEKSPRGGKMSRSFELSPDGRQLYENLRIESSGRNNHSTDLHYVYEIVPDATSPRK